MQSPKNRSFEFVFSFTILAFVATCPSNFLQAQSNESNWTLWRGPNGNGIAADRQNPVTEWSEENHIIWKTKLTGRGHSSPIVVGDKIFISTAVGSDETQRVICCNRDNGSTVWEKVVSEGQFNPRIHRNNTHASPTIASDGERLFVVFNNHRQAQVTALDFDGEILWQKFAGGFVPAKYQFGFAASPTVYESTVIVSSEFEKDGFIAAFDCESGDEVWRIERPNATSYSSPIIATVADREQLLISGGRSVSGYDPKTGKELWSVPAKWTVSCGTLVWDGDLVFASGGYPTGQTIAVNARTGEMVWENATKCYEQSLLLVDGYIYAVADNGVAYCWKASDGTVMWRNRLGGSYSSSPILAGGNIYVSNEAAKTFVFKPNPKEFELVAENRLGDIAFATPAFVNNKIYTRVEAVEEGTKTSYLYCIGE